MATPDNISASIINARQVTKKSTKTGADYTMLEVTFNLGEDQEYKFATFLTDEQKALIGMAKPLKGSF